MLRLQSPATQHAKRAPGCTPPHIFISGTATAASFYEACPGTKNSTLRLYSEALAGWCQALRLASKVASSRAELASSVQARHQVLPALLSCAIGAGSILY